MKLEIKWVSIIFGLHVLWHVAERILGLYGDRVEYQEMSSMLFFVVYAIIMYMAISDLKSRNNGLLNKRHGLLSGLFISLILVALAPVMVALLMFVIQPRFFEVMISATTTNGEFHSYDQAYQEFNYWNFVSLYMAGYLLVGALSAALWSYKMHKMPDPLED